MGKTKELFMDTYDDMEEIRVLEAEYLKELTQSRKKQKK